MVHPGPSRKAWLRVAARSTEGPVRPHNEDAVAVFALGGGGARGDGKLTPAALPGAWPADAGVALVALDRAQSTLPAAARSGPAPSAAFFFGQVISAPSCA